MSFFKFPRDKLIEERPGLFCKVITGGNIQVCYILLRPGFAIDHCNVEEQMGYFLSGRVQMTIGGETKMCKAGDAYHVPPNVPYRVEVPEDTEAEMIEFFSPIKKEYIQK